MKRRKKLWLCANVENAEGQYLLQQRYALTVDATCANCKSAATLAVGVFIVGIPIRKIVATVISFAYTSQKFLMNRL